uniref:Uncharacterized protein n=1 Tax=Setaria viridis TaxID=4556 RepID=A0A4U6T2E5_SETVI|nr:hypothetical protein SEVIR_9G306401v2 [Setaria viridis]
MLCLLLIVTLVQLLCAHISKRSSCCPLMSRSVLSQQL